MPLTGLSFLAIGDSKTRGETCCTYTLGYIGYLRQDLTLFGIDATPGITTAGIKAGIDAYIASTTGTPGYILINLGTNDLPLINSGSLVEATWLSDMGYILDALHTKWPDSIIRLMRVYQSAFTTEQDLYDDTWIPDILAIKTYAGAGPDERTFLPGNTTDTTHPNATGYFLTYGEWLTNLGLA